jgi:hypothetical protein
VARGGAQARPRGHARRPRHGRAGELAPVSREGEAVFGVLFVCSCVLLLGRGKRSDVELTGPPVFLS